VAANRPSDWGRTLDEYIDREDQRVLVGVMIENETAVENLEEILSVPELGFVFIGPGDLSVSLQHPMDTDYPEVQETISTIKEACLEADMPVGRISPSAESTQQAVDDGYSLVRIGGEIPAAREVLSAHVANVERDI
jgi:2-dehydro-3-deoxyglucarate aldolase